MSEETNSYNDLVNPVPTSYEMMNNSGLLPGSNLKYETIYDMPIPNELETLDPNLDTEYVKMINAAAPSLNRYAPDALGNMNSPYPTQATPGYDPMKQQLPPDLTSSDGISRYLSNSYSEAADAVSDIPVVEDPIYSSRKSTNFDRYYNHPNFNDLGFHPYANNEQYYNENSSTWDDGVRMWDQFWNLAGTGFMSGYRSIGDMFTGNDYFSSGDLSSALEYEEAMNIGMSSKEGVTPFLQNTALNFGYTTGIVGSIALEELVLWGAAALQGGLNPASDAAAIARTGFNLSRLAKTIGQSFSLGKVYQGSRAMLNSMRDINKLKSFRSAAKRGGNVLGRIIAPNTLDTYKAFKSSKNVAQNMTNIAKGSRFAGSLYRDMRALNLALGESRLEGGFVYNDIVNEGISIKMRDKEGIALSSEDFNEIQQNAAEGTFYTTMLNAPVIYATNQLTIGTALKGRNPLLNRVFKDPVSGYAGRVLRTKPLKDATGKITRSPFEYVGGGLKGSLKQIKAAGFKGGLRGAGYGTLRYFSANIGEGVQELTQEAIQVGTKKYYTELINDPTSRGHDLFNLSLNDAVSSQMSGQGFETFMSGFLIGGMGSVQSKILFQGMPNLYESGGGKIFSKVSKPTRDKYEAYKANKEELIDNYVESMNKGWNQMAENPMALFDKNKLAHTIQNTTARAADANSDDAFNYIDQVDYSKFQNLYNIFSTDKQGEYKSMVSDLLKLTDEELAQAFPSASKEDMQNGKLRERLMDQQKQINAMEKAFMTYESKYQNPYNPSLYEPGSRAYREEKMKKASYDHYKFLMMFTEDSFKRSLERFESITGELASDPILKNIAATDLTVLLDPISLSKELNSLNNEIDVLDDSEENKKIKEDKIVKRDILSEYNDALLKSLEESKEEGLEFNKEKLKSNTKKHLRKYIDFLGKSKDVFPDNNRFDVVHDKIVDGYNLKDRADLYTKSILALNNPEIANDIFESSYNYFQDTYKKNREIFRESLSKDIFNKEKNTFLNKLYKEGIYMDPESVSEFSKDSPDMSKLSYFTDKGPINEVDDAKAFAIVKQMEDVFKKTSELEKNKKSEEKKQADQKKAEEIKKEEKDVVRSAKQEAVQDELASWTDFSLINSEPGNHRVLKDFLRDYYNDVISKTNNAPIINDWVKTPQAKKFMQTYKTIKRLWGSTLEKDDPNYMVDKGFKVWLNNQVDNPDVIDILNEAKLTISDFTDYIRKTSTKPVSTAGVIDIYEMPIGEGSNEFIYELRDKQNQPIKQEILNAADAQLSRTSLDLAKGERNKITKLYKQTEPYNVGTVEVAFGKVVKKTRGEGKGENFIVASTKSDFANDGFIYLLPVTSQDKLGDKRATRTAEERQTSQVGEFEYEYEIQNLDINASNANVAKVNQKEPVQIYTNEEGVGQELLTTVKEVLTPEELDNLTINVKRNEGGNKRTNKGLGKKDKSKEINNNIKMKTEKFFIQFVINENDLPNVLERLNETDSENLKNRNGQLGFLRNTSYDFVLPGSDKALNPLTLTDEELAKYVDVKSYKNKSSLEEYRNKYATQLAFLNELDKKLGKKSEATYTVKDFKNFEIETVGGQMDTAEGRSRLDDLKTSTYDGNYVLMVNTRIDKNTIDTKVYITNEKGEKLPFKESQSFKDKVIKASPGKYNNARFQRYAAIVKEDNGVISYIPLTQKTLNEEEQVILIKDLVGFSRELSKQSNKDAAIEFNKRFNDQFYLSANKSGYVVNVNLTQKGDLYINVYDRNRQAQVIDETLYTTSAELQNIENSEDITGGFKALLVKQQELINNIAKSKLEDPNITPAAKENLKKDSEFKIYDMLASFDQTNITSDNLIEDTDTYIGPNIRKDYSTELKTNSTKTQEVKDAASLRENKKPAPEIVQESTEQDLDKSINVANTLGALANPQVQNLQQELKDVQTKLKTEEDPKEKKKLNKKANELIEQLSSAFKYVSDFSNENITSIDVFNNWMAANLPDYIVTGNLNTLANNLRANGIRVGAFVLDLENLAGGYNLKGTIYTTPESPFKYHEAFHGVYRMMLTDQEQAKYRSVAVKEVRSKLKKEGKTLNSELKSFRNSNKAYSNMSDKMLKELYLEEYMADEFEKFKASPRSTKTDSFIKSLFNKIIDLIKKVLGTYSSTELQTLYESIDSGKFKSASIATNQFTNQANTGININANKIIPKARIANFETGDFGFEYLNSDMSKTLVASITADILDKEVNHDIENDGPFNINKAVSDSINDFADLYDPNNTINENKNELDKQLLKELNSAFTNFSNIIEEEVVEQLKLYDLKIQTIEQEANEFENDFGLRNTYQYSKSADMYGGFSNLPVVLRKYIGTTTLAEKDWFGNEYVKDGVQIRVPVDFAKAYNGFLKAAKNTSDPKKMMQNLFFYSRYNPQTKAVIDRLFLDLGVTIEDFVNDDIQTVKDSKIYMSFIKGFENYVADYVFVHRSDSDGRVVSYSAAMRDDANTQYDDWSKSIFTKYNSTLKIEANRNIVSSSLEKLQDAIEADEIDDNSLDNVINDTAEVLRDYVGISLSQNYLKNSILQSKDKYTDSQKDFASVYADEGVLEKNDVEQIRKAVSANNILTNEKDGVAGRLKKISVENAFFDESVGASIFRNPEGNFVYAHQQPSYNLVEINKLNDSQGDGAVISNMKETLPFNYLVNSPFFKALSAEDRLKVLKISGFKQSQNIENNEDYSITTVESDKSKGVKYGDLSPEQFLNTLISLYTYGYNSKSGNLANTVESGEGKTALAPSMLRVVEASNQSDSINLPVIKAVNKFGKKDKVTAEAVKAISDNIRSEFERIKTELKKGPEPSELIADYNADKSGQIYNAAGKAFTFYNTGEYLGDIQSNMISAAREDNNISFEEALKKAGKSLGALNKAIEDRLDTEFDLFLSEVNIDSVSSYLTKGLDVGGVRTAESIGSEKLLNIKPNDVKFNLKQIFVNDLINTTAINEILLEDEAVTLKDAVDAVKRAKAQTGQGPNIVVDIVNEKMGIEPLSNISAIEFTDPTGISSVTGESIDQADAQGYITPKAFRYMQFGVGRLQTEAQYGLINAVENANGLKISAEDYLGDDQSKGYAQEQAMINSKKYVYFDGQTYAKMSLFTLTKEFTSTVESNYTKAKPSKEGLHNLRVKMEAVEENSTENTIGIALPLTALKMKKVNVSRSEDIVSESEVPENKITKLSPEHMRLQMINPSNKMEISDPTQMKTIITAEQSDELADVVGEYNKAIIARQNLNMDNVEKLLEGDISPFLRYAQASLDASQSNSQLREFFELNDDGTAKYELNNPIAVDKYEQLFINYLANHTVKEKIPGISAALVSDFGVKVYRKVYSLDGDNLGRQEVIRDLDFEKNYSEEDIVEWNTLSDLSDAIAKSNGEGVIIVDELRHGLLDEDGNRYTEAILPPHHKESIDLSKTDGSIPSVLSKMFGIRIPSQDKHSSINIKVVDFMPAYYGSNIVTAKELVEIAGSDFDIDKLYIHNKEFYEEAGELKEYQDKFDDYVRYVNSKVDKKGTIYNEAAIKAEGEEVNDVEFGDVDLSDNAIRALRVLDLPTNKSDFENFDGIVYSAPINNKILDYKYELLGNSDMTTSTTGTPIAYQPATLDAVKEAVDQLRNISAIREAGNEESLSHNSLLGKFYAFRSNKAGAAGIGPVVKANLYLSLLGEKKAKVKAVVKKGGILEIAGVKYDEFGKLRTTDGKRIQDVISSLITMMTDNAKERYAGKAGLNVRNIGLVSNMVALGMPLYQAGLLINHPKIKEAYKQEDMSPGAFIKNITKPTTKKVTLEMLEKAANGEEMSEGDNDAIFREFLIANNITGYTANLAAITGMVNGFGSSTVEMSERMDQIRKLKEDGAAVKNIDEVLKSTWQGNMVDILERSNKILQKHLTSSTRVFNTIYDQLIGNINENTTSEVKDRIKKELLSFLVSKAYMNQGNEITNTLLYKDGDVQTISDIFTSNAETVEGKFGENYFYKYFANAHKATDKGNTTGIDYLSANTLMKLNDSQKIDLQSSFAVLFGNPETRNMAKTIINYMIAKDGLMMKYESLLQAVSPFTLGSYLNQASNVRKSFNSNKAEDLQTTFGEVDMQTITDEFINGYLQSNVNRDLIPPVTSVNIIKEGEFKGMYSINDMIEVAPGIEESFDLMFARYSTTVDGIPSTVYLKRGPEEGAGLYLYERINLEGSNNQTGIGFMFGDRPSNKDVRNTIKKANDQSVAPVDTRFEPTTSRQNEIANAIENNLAEYKDGKFTLGSKEDNKDDKPSQNQMTDINATFASLAANQEQLQLEFDNSNEDVAEEFLKKYYDNNSETQQKLISYGIRYREDLVNRYNDANKINSSLTMQSYLDDVIKKCAL